MSYRDTGHAETVKVTYDADKLSLDDILQYYFRVVDPTSLNKQGNDTGTQYRSGVYYTDPAEKAVIAAALKREQQKYQQPLVVENEPLKNFYDAEEYHQDYLIKKPQRHTATSTSAKPTNRCRAKPKPPRKAKASTRQRIKNQ